MIDVAPELRRAGEMFDALREGSRDGDGVTRASYGAGEQMAHDLVAALGVALDLDRRIDAAGNLYLTLPGRHRDAPAIMMGSHLDSVPEGGNYDGAAGVVAGMMVLHRLRRLGMRPRRDIAVMGVRAEELSWFPAPYIGSRAAFGMLESPALDDCVRRDTGRSLADHMREAGFDPEAIRRREKQIDPRRLRCWLEFHIEQGPVLVQRGVPTGIVTGIRGNLRYRHGRITGAYGHAGAEPRETRRDAVFAGAAFVQAIDRIWDDHERAGADLVCTVGEFHTDPRVHTMTKIPGALSFTMDIRSQDNAVLMAFDAQVRAEAARIGAARGVTIDCGPYTNALPGPIDPALRAILRDAADGQGIAAIDIASGAGHDAAVFGIAGVPTAMVFVRNEHGSHNPHEAMTIADFGEGLAILAAAVERIDAAD